jgi:hypothetical protein
MRLNAEAYLVDPGGLGSNESGPGIPFPVVDKRALCLPGSA